MIFSPLFYRMHSPCWACFKSHWIAKCLGLLFMHLRTWSFSFIFVVFDQSLPPTLPNYRKNSVQSRKQVLWIHISFVGQWSSCMWHNFCWHIGYSPFSFFFFLFMSEKKTISIQVTSDKGWRWFLCDLGRVISTSSVAISSSTTFPAPVFRDSMALWPLITSHSKDLFIWQREGLPKFPLFSLLWISWWKKELVKLIIRGLAGPPLHSNCGCFYLTSQDSEPTLRIVA